MATKRTRKITKKIPGQKKAVQAGHPRPATRLRKLVDNLSSVETSEIGSCIAALAKVRRILTAQQVARLKPELALLEKAVVGCPENCGCRRGLKRVIISTDGKMLGELTSDGGKFSGIALNGAGEDLLGEEMSTLRYTGLTGAPGFDSPVQVRDDDFLEAFVAWCGEKGCEALVLDELYLPVWSRLQESKIDDGQVLQLMRKLKSVPSQDALRLVDSLSAPSGSDICC